MVVIDATYRANELLACNNDVKTKQMKCKRRLAASGFVNKKLTVDMFVLLNLTKLADL